MQAQLKNLMENFIVSARKYRPSTFMSVVGQQALVTTLKNAIAKNQLAHAYLFCGPRGVGKTTCARIFAKTINCQNLTPEYEACNQCESCVSFNEQRSYNIHELDAASNNSVEDIRSLIEQVRIPPQIGKYSVYIIDEVHMLSQAAFNAFLKTLEEPPAHALFILATTEKHKIIPTILSRCQIYDFNRISAADTVAHLQFVAGKEGITAEPDALNVIAQKADGGMRDALSIFDQVVSFCGTNITYRDVIANLNVLDYDYYFRLVEAFREGDLQQSWLIFDEILSKGFDGNHFVTGLSAHLRDVLVSRDPQTVQLLEVGATIGEKYKAQAAACSLEFLYKALTIANQCDLDYRTSNNKRLLVEIMLMRLCGLSDKKKTLIESEEPVVLQKAFVENTTKSPEVAIPPVSTPTPITAEADIAAVADLPSVPATAENSDNKFAPPMPTVSVAQPATQPVAQPTPTVTMPRSISINNIQKPTTTETVVETPKRRAPVDAAQLKTAWKDYTHTIDSKGRLQNTMQMTFPNLKASEKFDISVSNAFQEKEILEEKPAIMRFLADKLQNDFLEMTIVINEVQEQVKLPSDMYQTIKDSNENVRALAQVLNLEII